MTNYGLLIFNGAMEVDFGRPSLTDTHGKPGESR